MKEAAAEATTVAEPHPMASLMAAGKAEPDSMVSVTAADEAELDAIASCNGDDDQHISGVEASPGRRSRLGRGNNTRARVLPTVAPAPTRFDSDTITRRLAEYGDEDRNRQLTSTCLHIESPAGIFDGPVMVLLPINPTGLLDTLERLYASTTSLVTKELGRYTPWGDNVFGEIMPR